ncbi:MAG: methylated-DNA--[protein]-cysteine S-methyltransferase [Planctomycetota bacterium]
MNQPNLTTQVYSIAPFQLGYAVIVTIPDRPGRHVSRVELATDRFELTQSFVERFPNAVSIDDCVDSKEAKAHEKLVVRVVDLLDRGQTADAQFPLHFDGTEFQKSVWQGLRAIPFGQTTTYQQLAEAIGRPSAVRAVANACGANPFAILVPCHRVLRTDGGIGGFRWGVEIKRRLLALEESLPTSAQKELSFH